MGAELGLLEPDRRSWRHVPTDERERGPTGEQALDGPLAAWWAVVDVVDGLFEIGRELGQGDYDALGAAARALDVVAGDVVARHLRAGHLRLAMDAWRTRDEPCHARVEREKRIRGSGYSNEWTVSFVDPGRRRRTPPPRHVCLSCGRWSDAPMVEKFCRPCREASWPDVAEGAREVVMARRTKVEIDEGKLRELYENALDDGEIAEKLGCSADLVRRRRKALDLPSHWGPGRRPLTDAARARSGATEGKEPSVPRSSRKTEGRSSRKTEGSSRKTEGIVSDEEEMRALAEDPRQVRALLVNLALLADDPTRGGASE